MIQLSATNEKREEWGLSLLSTPSQSRASECEREMENVMVEIYIGEVKSFVG